ncbi:PD-(D/E)XK nuclease family protein [Arenicella xantha]|uniref:PD-(D/E)XK nuclease superfamily protein n=1 Tax=Arenicella xantha TaxID=644221 RepID=A0A395JQZ3_9GAMM|nr:PD-(D/E)XK nuclease family protein [Arenicella xantha]RBP52975.1 PD-(D/E)XK nuclease superfamily protein [Arenicella xantha]
MNLFKILANGNGSLNEPNVSAFLGYLLDPNQNHGLEFVFLERFLDQFLNINEDFQLRKYDYEVHFEQGFQRETTAKKEIVDIVILCFERAENTGKQSIVQSALSVERTLKNIFLIENKITKGAKNTQQLSRQYAASIGALGLEADSNKVISLYVTPTGKNYSTEFMSFDNQRHKFHLTWESEADIGDLNIDDEITSSISRVIESIIYEESIGRIEAIDVYTRHTLISFLKFIESGFKSEATERKENKEGKYQRDLSHSVASLKQKKPQLINSRAWAILSDVESWLTTYESPHITYRCSKTHPISVFYDDKKVLSLSKLGKNLRFYFILSRNFDYTNEHKDYLTALLSGSKGEVSDSDEGVKRDSFSSEEAIYWLEEIVKICSQIS